MDYEKFFARMEAIVQDFGVVLAAVKAIEASLHERAQAQAIVAENVGHIASAIAELHDGAVAVHAEMTAAQQEQLAEQEPAAQGDGQ